LPERSTHDYARNGVTSLFAAFNIADGTVISELHRRHRAAEFLKFPRKIDKAVPAGPDVHLACGNLATRKTPEVQQWLARSPRFHAHFTPTGSSWINQVSGSATSPARRSAAAPTSPSRHSKPTSATGPTPGTRASAPSPGRRPPRKSSTPWPNI
jgi:hypothetical protein